MYNKSDVKTNEFCTCLGIITVCFTIIKLIQNKIIHWIQMYIYNVVTWKHREK